MKEDVLEQIVDDYLNLQGYFTTHNVPFGPDRSHPDFDPRLDSVPSDIDVIAVDPRKRGVDRVVVVTCKSWQGGFQAERLLKELRGEKKNPKRATWHSFRELWKPKWSEAFRAEIEARTGATKFTYQIAVTRLTGSPDGWATEPEIRQNLPGCRFGFIELGEMWDTVVEKMTERPAASEIGRLAQLLKASGRAGD